MNLTRNVVFDFGDRVLKSYADFGLIQKSAPEVTPPAPKTNYVDVPGANGGIDLSEVLMGHVVYEDREIVLHFRRVMPSLDGAQDKRLEDYLHFAACLQGLRCKLYLDESDKFCFDCRLTVGQMSASGDAWDVDVTAVARPYRTTATPTVTTVTMTNDDLLEYDLEFSNVSMKDGVTTYTLQSVGFDGYAKLRFFGEVLSSSAFEITFISQNGRKAFSYQYDVGEQAEIIIPISDISTINPSAVFALTVETSKYDPTEMSGMKPGRAERIYNGQSSLSTLTSCTRPTVPKFACTNDGATIAVVKSVRPPLVLGASLHVAAGETKSNNDIVLHDMLELMITPDTYPDGNGVITITYQEGVL